MTAEHSVPPPVVSIIMPVWRPSSAWLREAVTSALDDPCDCELIVVDDGCESSVAAMLDDISDRRMRVLRIEHAGQAAALNAGIAAAKGDWFRFVDADDVLTRGSTTYLLGLANGEAIVTYGSTLVCDEDLRPRRSIGSTLQGDVLVDCLCGRFHTRHPSMLFPRSVVERAGWWIGEIGISADWDFVVRALEHAHVRGNDTVATLYRRHTQSMSGQTDIAAGEESRRRVLNGYFARHPERRGSAVEQEAWGALHRDSGEALWRAGQYRSFVSSLARRARLEPVDTVVDTARLVGRYIRRRAIGAVPIAFSARQ